MGSWSEDWLVEGEGRACMYGDGRGFGGEVWGAGVGFRAVVLKGWGMWVR